MRYTPELLHEGFMFPETPRWNAARNAFYFADIDRGEIHEMKQGEKPGLWFKGEDLLSGYVFGADGEIIATSATKRKLVSLRKTGPGLAQAGDFADLTTISGFAINDMLRSKRGDIYVDSIAFNFMASVADPLLMCPSPLLRVAPDRSVSVATREVNFPNGMAIGPDARRLLVADSLDECVYAFELKADGSLGARSTFAAMPGEMPDGISLDRDGGVWVASHHKVLRVVEGGTVTDEVDMGSTRATACMLGGQDGKTLLITASDSHDRRIIRDNPSGRIFQVRVQSPGAGLPSHYN